jgi:hypothetical protein
VSDSPARPDAPLDDRDRGNETRRVLKLIRPEDRRYVKWRLSEGLAFGPEKSHEAREMIAKFSEQAILMTELLEPLIKNGRDLDGAYDVLIGMDLEGERLSELNEQR